MGESDDPRRIVDISDHVAASWERGRRASRRADERKLQRETRSGNIHRIERLRWLSTPNISF